MQNGGLRKERFFIRLIDPNNGDVYYEECEGIVAFEIKGFRFFFYNEKITDAFSGSQVASMNRWGMESVEEFIQKARELTEQRFDYYLDRIKKLPRAAWKRWEFRPGSVKNEPIGTV